MERGRRISPYAGWAAPACVDTLKAVQELTIRKDVGEEPFLTSREVLKYLQVNLQTLYFLVRSGAIPAVRVGRQYRFRRGDVDAALDRRGPAVAPVATDAGSSTARHRVLIADDDAQVRGLLAKLLTLADCEVDVVSGGRAAIERLRVGGYDLLITDLKMPDVHGFDVIREGKRGTTALAVVIVTGCSTEAAAIAAANLGVAGYLTKPFNAPQVFEAASRALGVPVGPRDLHAG